MAGNKFTKKYSKKEGFGVKEIIAILLVIPIAIYVYLNFMYVDKTPYGYDSYNQDVHEYLMSSPNYQAAYTSGKKVILHYHPKDKDNPYFGLFKKALDDIKRITDISDMYEFASYVSMNDNRYYDKDTAGKLLKNEKALKRVCRSFCVINPQKREVYFWFEPKQRDLSKAASTDGKEVLIDNLKALEFWGIELKH